MQSRVSYSTVPLIRQNNTLTASIYAEKSPQAASFFLDRKTSSRGPIFAHPLVGILAGAEKLGLTVSQE